MQPELWAHLNREHIREAIAFAEQERLARSLSKDSHPFRSALLILANGLIASGQGLKTIASRSDRNSIQATNPCQ